MCHHTIIEPCITAINKPALTGSYKRISPMAAQQPTSHTVNSLFLGGLACLRLSSFRRLACLGCGSGGGCGIGGSSLHHGRLCGPGSLGCGSCHGCGWVELRLGCSGGGGLGGSGCVSGSSAVDGLGCAARRAACGDFGVPGLRLLLVTLCQQLVVHLRISLRLLVSLTLQRDASTLALETLGSDLRIKQHERSETRMSTQKSATSGCERVVVVGSVQQESMKYLSLQRAPLGLSRVFNVLITSTPYTTHPTTTRRHIRSVYSVWCG